MTKRPKIAKARGRSVREWIGKTPDSSPPDYVRLRIFDRHKGVCHWSKVKIKPGDKWDLDHIKRLEDGGENRESNLAPILRDKHRKKTAEETAKGKQADRVRKRHVGITKPAGTIKSRGFEPVEKPPKPKGKSDLSHLGPPTIARRFR